MNYRPAPMVVGDNPRALREYLDRELQRLATAINDNSAVVFYRTNHDTESSLSAGDSANYRMGLSTNVLRISASVTLTLTGIADTTPYRERVLINVGTGVVVLKSEGTESSASFRFALPANWQLSANATATLLYDPVSSRHRGISRT